MDITEEMLAAGRRAAREAYRGWSRLPAADRPSFASFVAEATDAVIVAAAPLIAAQALRQAAEFVRDDESDGAFSHGDRCSYGPPGQCDCERGITYRWLVAP